MSLDFTQEMKKSSIPKNAIWIVIGVFMAVIMAGAIAGTEWMYLIIVLCPFLIYLSLIKPFLFPFGLFVVLLPFDSILVLEGAHGATLTKFLGVASILALLLSGIAEKKIKKPDKTVVWWGLFVVFGLLSVFWAIRPEMMYPRIPTALGLFLLYLLISSYKIREKDFDIVKKLIIYGGFAASIYATFLYFFKGGSERVTLAAGEQQADPNQFAFSLLIPFALTINAALTERKKPIKVLDWLVLGILAYAILISGSRGVLLGTITIVLTLLFKKGSKHLLIPIMVILFIIFQFLPGWFFERISQSTETGGAGRLDIWSAGLEALKNYWLSGYYGLVGIGLDNYPTIFLKFGPNFNVRELAPHNIYLGAAVELGIIGFLIMIIAIYKHYVLITNKYYRYDRDSVFLKAAFFGLMISAFFLDVIWRKSFWLIWILIMMHNTVKKEKSPI